MLDIKILKNSEYFKEKTLKSGELLFDEQEIDNNFYIIESGELVVEKYTTKQKKETKILANLKAGDFLGEASLTNPDTPKQVRIRAIKDTKLIFIEAKNLEKFLEKNSLQAKNFFLEIIKTITARVNTGNKYITSIYEINKSINKIETINYKEIFKILEKINLVLETDFLIYLEKNPVLENIYSYRYDSRNPGKIQNKVIDLKKFSSKSEFNIEDNINLLSEKITIGNEILGMIIVGKKQNFSENEKRLFLGIITSIAGIIKQKEIFDELRNKTFMKGE